MARNVAPNLHIEWENSKKNKSINTRRSVESLKAKYHERRSNRMQYKFSNLRLTAASTAAAIVEMSESITSPKIAHKDSPTQ